MHLDFMGNLWVTMEESLLSPPLPESHYKWYQGKSSAGGADTGSTKYPAASISNQGHEMNGDRMLDGGQQSVLHLWHGHENKSIMCTGGKTNRSRQPSLVKIF